MSMISMQVDRLRDRAMRVEVFLEGSTDAIPTDTNEQLRDAADTILELREMAQKANAENAKLRELAMDMHRWMGRAVYDGSVREYEYRDFGLVLRELGIDADDEDGYEAEDD